MFIKKAKIKTVNPMMLHIIPPTNPRFSADVESAKQLKQEGSPIPIEEPKKKANKTLVKKSLLETVVKRNVEIAPTNGHKYRNFVRTRGRSFEPSIAATATLTK
jgi:hypothetical protein